MFIRIETLADRLKPLRRRLGRNQRTELARQNFRLSYRETCRTMLLGKSKTNEILPCRMNLASILSAAALTEQAVTKP